MYKTRIVLFGLLGLRFATVDGYAQDGQLQRDVVSALEAVIGNFLFNADGDRRSLTVSEYRSPYYPSLRFFRGDLDIGGGDTASALAVELPSGAVVPLASAPMRRLISPLAQVNTDDPSSLTGYATELLKMEGEVGINAQPVRDVAQLPDDARLRARELGIVLHAPEARPIGRSIPMAKELVFWLTQGSLLIRATVIIGAERPRDQVVAADAVMGY